MEWIIGSLLLVIVVCLIFLKKEKQEFSLFTTPQLPEYTGTDYPKKGASA